MNAKTKTLDYSWQQSNQRYLMKALIQVREALEAKIKGEYFELENIPEEEFRGDDVSALKNLCHVFDLSNFERNILLLCAGIELDGSLASLCGAVMGDTQRNYPTFSLALTVFTGANWGALTPEASLRKWRLIEIGAGHGLTTSPLRIDERILHYLAGVSHLDERLLDIVQPIKTQEYLVHSHEQLAQQIAKMWLQSSSDINLLPAVNLCGEDIASKRSIAAAACGELNLKLYVMAGDDIPSNSSELNLLMRLWEREYILSNCALLLECDEVENVDANRESAIARFTERLNSPVIISSYERRRQRQRLLLSFDIHKPTSIEQRHIWENALGSDADNLNGQVEALVSQFNLNAPAIYAASKSAIGYLAANHQNTEIEAPILGKILWDSCRDRARQRLDDLAQRIPPAATWDDLVLPPAQSDILRDIVAHVRQRAKVYETWGFGGKSGRGLGISALFAGASGTGKTTAAEVMAGELRLDLYRIDLSSVVSKYIGETEKNLRRVFDAAEAGGAILLFDEADALFGKRSEVKDSHDRHANIEVSYLLQRMESYRGLAILTTNLKNALDQAFLRRLRFVVQFPFPDTNQRAEIWRRVFPKDTPTQGLDVNKLARLSVAGGNIRNIALSAAFIAADAGEVVQMKHLLEAAKTEYVKLEKPLTDTEVKGWV